MATVSKSEKFGMQSTNKVGIAVKCQHLCVSRQEQKSVPYVNLYEAQTQQYSTGVS